MDLSQILLIVAVGGGIYLALDHFGIISYIFMKNKDASIDNKYSHLLKPAPKAFE